MNANSHQLRPSDGNYLLIILALPVLYLASNIAIAYDWNNDYGANYTLGYNDNFRLSTSNEIDTTSSTLGIFANVEGTSEISSLRFAMGANGDSYSESSIDSSSSYNLSIDAARRGERLSTSLRAALVSASTTETELLDSGAVVDGTRDTASISPGLSYQVNERNSASFNLGFRDVSYDTVSLIEYTDNSVSFGWGYQLDETSSISTSLRHSVYEPDFGDSTDTNSVSIGYGWRAFEETTYNATIGYSEVDRPGSSESGSDYGININHQRDEKNRFSLALRNSYQASGQGGVRDEVSLNLKWNHGLTERARLTMSATGVSTDERDYISIQAGTNYQYAPEITLSASYRWREQDSDAGKADSSSVLFSVSYSPL